MLLVFLTTSRSIPSSFFFDTDALPLTGPSVDQRGERPPILRRLWDRHLNFHGPGNLPTAFSLLTSRGPWWIGCSTFLAFWMSQRDYTRRGKGTGPIIRSRTSGADVSRIKRVFLKDSSSPGRPLPYWGDWTSKGL